MTRSDYWFLCLLIILSPRLSESAYGIYIMVCVVFLLWNVAKECIAEYRKDGK